MLFLLEVNLPTSNRTLTLSLWEKPSANYAAQGCFDELTAGTEDGIVSFTETASGANTEPWGAFQWERKSSQNVQWKHKAAEIQKHKKTKRNISELSDE